MKSYKKVLIVLLLAVFGMGAAQAQFRFGVKAGLNLNSLHLSNMSQNFTDDNKCGTTLGVMTEFQVPLIGLCFDLSAMYTHMGSKLEGPDGEKVSYNKNFLEIPLNLKYKFGLPVIGSVFTPYLFTGPSFAFKLDKNSIHEFSILRLSSDSVECLKIHASTLLNTGYACACMYAHTGTHSDVNSSRSFLGNCSHTSPNP